MLSLTEISKFYPEKLVGFKRSFLREYLQCKILQIIFSSKFASKLVFIGGTALRILYDNQRFSEDIDLDNFNLTIKEFDQIAQIIRKELEKDGYQIEIRNVFKNAFHCYIKFPGLLFENDLSGYESEKVLIQLDTLAQGFDYAPEQKILNRFDIFSAINIASLDILLAQKIFTIFNRKTPKGRDFYDTVFLFSKTQPNFEYLDKKLEIKNLTTLKDKLLDYCAKIDFEQLSHDVGHFLFEKNDLKRIELFKETIKSL